MFISDEMTEIYPVNARTIIACIYDGSWQFFERNYVLALQIFTLSNVIFLNFLMKGAIFFISCLRFKIFQDLVDSRNLNCNLSLLTEALLKAPTLLEWFTTEWKSPSLDIIVVVQKMTIWIHIQMWAQLTGRTPWALEVQNSVTSVVQNIHYLKPSFVVSVVLKEWASLSRKLFQCECEKMYL